MDLMLWVKAETGVVPDRTYPAAGCSILVIKTVDDRAKVLLALGGKEFKSKPIILREMPDEEYATARRHVSRRGDKWSWRVRYADIPREPSIMERHQMHHPGTGHAMCIACMHPLEAGEFNVCHPCASENRSATSPEGVFGNAREMWTK